MFGRTHKEIRITINTPPESMVVEADKRQIEQVLLNIYVNALQAMPNGGDLYLDTGPIQLDEESCRAYQLPPGHYVKISMTDTGVGMSDEVRQRVFDPFFTTKDKARGTGLGLASAYGIIRNHGGMITVYSKLGHGTSFNIYLPGSRRQPAPAVPMDKELVGGTESVLLVDDEQMIMEVGRAMLERLGYRVVTADNGQAAVASVSKMGEDIDLVILDLIMPKIDGGKTFDRIRSIHPSLPVILSSGYSINGQATEIMERGCNGFIQKPFNILELARKIREVLDTENKPPKINFPVHESLQG
jgi:CheY-like chemotaxis protein